MSKGGHVNEHEYIIGSDDDAGSDQPRTNPSEELRQMGIDCAVMIAADAPSWVGAAKWLEKLPICQAISESHLGVDSIEEKGEPCLIVGLDEKPVNPASPPVHQFGIYDNETEFDSIHGPILRRLTNGWSAATYRFLHQQRGDDWLYDFGLDDAQRIALLAALTFNRDFDGAMIGLGWEWEHPSDCKASFEGRGWTWSYLTSGLFAEETLVEVIGISIDYLRRVTPINEQPRRTVDPKAEKEDAEPRRRPVAEAAPTRDACLRAIAVRVDEIVRDPAVMTVFRERMAVWRQDRDALFGEVHEKERKLHQHFSELVATDPRLQDESAGPPEEDWSFEYYPPLRICGWVPEELWAVLVVDTEPPLPLPNRSLTDNERVVCLAAVHDHLLRTAEPINPWRDDRMRNVGYHALMSNVDRLEEDRLDELGVMLERVEDQVKEALRAKPAWDQDRRELRLGSLVCKRYQNTAENQWIVLNAFEEDGWPARIDDPLPGKKGVDRRTRLRKTIRDLNHNLQYLRFRGDSTGTGVVREGAGVARA